MQKFATCVLFHFIQQWNLVNALSDSVLRLHGMNVSINVGWFEKEKLPKFKFLRFFSIIFWDFKVGGKNDVEMSHQ